MSKTGNGFEKIVKTKYTSCHFVALHISTAWQEKLAESSNLHRGYLLVLLVCTKNTHTHTHTVVNMIRYNFIQSMDGNKLPFKAWWMLSECGL